MIKNCGIGVAMENGLEEIKNNAKYICGKNNEDGIAKWIEENIL
jgi:hydroxymethylpyrimidine pyrophosphatase-like HAD family hydrolase